MEITKDIKVRIQEEEVLRLQGYGKGKLPSKEVKEILIREIEEGYRLIEPISIYTEVKVEAIESEIIRLAGGLALRVGNPLKDWSGAEYLGVALCTIGSRLEERVAQLFDQQELAPALMLDSVGSVAVESVADQINYLFCHRASLRGINKGPRLSPGYGKWALSDQRVLFRLLPGEEIGIRLNDQCMMIPRKSVSFCLGMGRTIGDSWEASPCRHCVMEGCQYRK